MAANVLKDLEAISGLLTSMRKAPCFAQVAHAQRLVVEMSLQRAHLGPESAAEIVQFVQKMHWPPPDLEALVNAKAITCTQVSLAPASKMQNFVALHAYFTKTQWIQLESAGVPSDAKLDLIVTHAASMGMRFPTEPSVQHLVGLYLHISEGYHKALKLTGTMKLHIVKFVKRKIKEAGKGLPVSVVTMLPLAPKDFAQQHQNVFKPVFGEELHCKCSLNMN